MIKQTRSDRMRLNGLASALATIGGVHALIFLAMLAIGYDAYTHVSVTFWYVTAIVGAIGCVGIYVGIGLGLYAIVARDSR